MDWKILSLSGAGPLDHRVLFCASYVGDSQCTSSDNLPANHWISGCLSDTQKSVWMWFNSIVPPLCMRVHDKQPEIHCTWLNWQMLTYLAIAGLESMVMSQCIPFGSDWNRFPLNRIGTDWNPFSHKIQNWSRDWEGGCRCPDGAPGVGVKLRLKVEQWFHMDCQLWHHLDFDFTWI
jgi:hypothetical protein